MRTSRSTMLTLLAGAAAMTVLAVVAGCGEGGTNDAGPTQPVLSSIVVTKTGGLAGVNQLIEIHPDGTWAYTDRRTNATEGGALTEAQRSQLLALVSAPAFRTELSKTPVATNCADTFQYTLKTENQTASFDECDQANRPAVMAVLNAIGEATPF